MRTGHTVLFIDERPFDRDRVVTALTHADPGLHIEFIATAGAALDFLQRAAVEAVFVNESMIDMNAVEFSHKLRDLRVDVPLILMTASGSEAALLAALEEGFHEHAALDLAGADGLPVVLERARLRHRIARELAERQRAIVESQKQWMATFDAITDYIFVLDEKRKLVKVNHAFATSVGMHPRDIIGKECSEIFGTDIYDANTMTLIREDGLPHMYEKAIGDEFYQISVFPLHEPGRLMTIHIMKNITEIRRLKDQLYHSDKLASLGLLVSGVAHEINNPLTGTIAYTELLRMKITDEETLKELKKILDSAERCKKIVDNLLTFSRQRTPAKSLESINDIIDRAIDLRGYWLRSSNIEVARDYDEVSTVFVDAQQIQQVVLNILLNAEQAITDAGRRDGRITFVTRFDKSARSVIIKTLDNGPGIPPAIVSKIFDPFFTTKPVGVGTGLGLSISHGIITEHGGSIQVENPEGGGALFTITLPTGTGDMLVSQASREKGRKG